jgi:aminoglycoside phosphotransferase (APT) family kinase protein
VLASFSTTNAVNTVAAAHAAYPAHLLDLALATDAATRLGLSPGPLTLQRVWPQAADHFGLEYRDAAGAIIPGQWIGDAVQFAKIVRATERAAASSRRGAVITLPADQILLQANGTDRRLVGLAPLLDEPGATMVLHRPERRAVVRLARPEGVIFAKVVRPERIHDLARIMLAIHEVAAGHFRTPPIRSLDVKQGILYLATLPGRSLHDLLAGTTLTEAAAAAGTALRHLHALPIASQAQPHTAAAEVAVLEQWVQRLAWLAPTLTAPISARLPQVAAALRSATSPVALLHRDYYDKQIFLAPDGKPGLLDFDLLACGEAALDVANALVHFELRASQGHYRAIDAEHAKAAFLESYRPPLVVAKRIQAYADASRLRLACVYSCRPIGLAQVSALLTSIGQTV